MSFKNINKDLINSKQEWILIIASEVILKNVGKSIGAKLQQIQHNQKHVQISWDVLYLK